MKEKIKWDFKINDPIEYFDSSKSYEITGYRPINKDNGLDFNPDLFMETVFYKEKFGVHTQAPLGSELYKIFWQREILRCKDGLTINGYRITGNHYFFLNFYKLLTVDSVDKASSGRDVNHPNFWSKHYEYFHYIELCQYLKKDACALKARGVGFSEIAASMGACLYTCVRNSKTMYVASQEGFLLENGVVLKVWDVLEILNLDTEGALRHASMKKKEPLWRRASLVDRQGQELKTSFKSEIFGKIVTNPRKLRGVRLDLLLFEESGSFPLLTTAYTQSEALVNILGKKIGIRVLWGKQPCSIKIGLKRGTLKLTILCQVII